jgi:carbamoyltransferase
VRRRSLIEESADALVAGKIVGWMEGRCEFGPRALGHRSLLAAPHDPAMRDRLNRDIKYRESSARSRRWCRSSRPTASSSFRRAVRASPISCRASFPVRPEWRERLAAITHVDGTARVQALEQAFAPRLYALLQAYGGRTGLPVLLNTSLNLAGEPIACSAAEGYSTFRRSGIDLLVADGTRVRKRERVTDRATHEEELA